MHIWKLDMHFILLVFFVKFVPFYNAWWTLPLEVLKVGRFFFTTDINEIKQEYKGNLFHRVAPYCR